MKASAMQAIEENASSTTIQVCRLVGRRAGNLFLIRHLSCSSAVLLVLNQGLGGDLAPELAINLASGLGEGLGGGGCTCGSLNGGALALGLFLGRGRPAFKGNNLPMSATRRLHDRFKAAFGTTCCRVLVKNIRRGSQLHYRLCAERTAKSAQWCAELILSQRPGLIHQVDWHYLRQKETLLSAPLTLFANMLKP